MRRFIGLAVILFGLVLNTALKTTNELTLNLAVVVLSGWAIYHVENTFRTWGTGVFISQSLAEFEGCSIGRRWKLVK